MGDWREQLFVWRGKYKIDEVEGDARAEKSVDRHKYDPQSFFPEDDIWIFPLCRGCWRLKENERYSASWSGSWQSYTTEDVTSIPSKDWDTDMEFKVKGDLIMERSPERSSDPKKSIAGIFAFYIDKGLSWYLLDNGDGPQKHYDLKHTIWIRERACDPENPETRSCMCSDTGDIYEVIARGRNEFSPFVSYGMFEVNHQGANLTLARRYVDSKDWRLKAEIEKLFNHAFSPLGEGCLYTDGKFLQFPHLHVPLRDRPKSKTEDKKRESQPSDKNENAKKKIKVGT